MDWSQALAVEGRRSPDEDTAALERVTADDVNRVARAYLHFDNSIDFILTPESSGQPVSSHPTEHRGILCSERNAIRNTSRLGKEGSRPPLGTPVDVEA